MIPQRICNSNSHKICFPNERPEKTAVSVGKRYFEVTEQGMTFTNLKLSNLRVGVLDPMRESTVSP